MTDAKYEDPAEDGGRPDFTVAFGGDAISRDMVFLQQKLGKGPVGVVRHCVSCMAGQMGADLPDAKHEAPAEGAGEAVWRIVERVANLTVAGGDPLQDPAFAQYPAIADLVAKAQSALRARSSAPEAREGDIREILRKQAADPKRYLNPTHAASDNVFVDHDPEARFIADDYAAIPPAAPSADKLLAVVAAAKDVRLAAWTDRFNRIHGHPSVEALEKALAALKAEGA